MPLFCYCASSGIQYLNILETTTGAFYIKILHFTSFLHVQIHSWNVMFCEPCSPLQGEKQPNWAVSSSPFLYYATCWSDGGKEENYEWGEGTKVEGNHQSSITENSFPYFMLYLLSLFRLLGCFCISIASLYFLVQSTKTTRQ